MSPAHQVFLLRDRESLPTGEGVRVLRENFISAQLRDAFAIHQRGTDDERHGTVIDFVEDEGLSTSRQVR